MAAGSTYTPIETQTLVSAQASVLFSNISQSYTDLILESVVATDYTAGSSYYYYIRTGNGSIDTGSNYSVTQMYGNGSTATSARQSGATAIYAGESPSNIGGTGRLESAQSHFMNYSNTTTYKTILSRVNNSTSFVFSSVGLWRSTSAINRIEVFPGSTYKFVAGSTFTLYGIAKA